MSETKTRKPKRRKYQARPDVQDPALAALHARFRQLHVDIQDMTREIAALDRKRDRMTRQLAETEHAIEEAACGLPAAPAAPPAASELSEALPLPLPQDAS